MRAQHQAGNHCSLSASLTDVTTPYEQVGDYVHVRPGTFDQLAEAVMVEKKMPAYAVKGRFHKGGGSQGLRAFGIALIMRLSFAKGSKKVLYLLWARMLYLPF